MNADKHTILIAGDLAPLGHPGNLLVEGQIQRVFGDVLSIIRSSDCFVANLECPLTNSMEKLSKSGPNIKANPNVAHMLGKAGISVVSLANNHIFDYGLKGVEETKTALDDNAIQWYGVGENAEKARVPLFVALKNFKLGLLSYAEHEFNWSGDDRWCTSMLEPELNILQIQHVAGRCDALVVLLHAGCENWHYPSPRIVKLCRAYAEAGSAAVLVSHSHAVMGTEFHKGVPIVYGLGNFLFDRGQKNLGWRLGTIARLTFGIGQPASLEITPILADKETGCIDLVSGSNMERFQQFHRSISEPLKCMSEIEELWKCYCASESSKFTKEMLKAITAMLPGVLLRLLLFSDKSTRRDSYYRKGATILRGFFVCENHKEVLGQIFQLVREDHLREYRRRGRKVAGAGHFFR